MSLCLFAFATSKMSQIALHRSKAGCLVLLELLVSLAGTSSTARMQPVTAARHIYFATQIHTSAPFNVCGGSTSVQEVIYNLCA